MIGLQVRRDLRVRERQHQMERAITQIAQERVRTEALERLITLLEARGRDGRQYRSPASLDDADPLSRLSRLRAARAAYALATAKGMQRVGAGAWIRYH